MFAGVAYSGELIQNHFYWGNVIFDLASIALHPARGFSHAGVFKAAGWKHGDWRDVVFMQRALSQGGDTPPDAPGLSLIDKKPPA